MAASDWTVPWRLPLALLTAALCFLLVSTVTTPFPKDLEPISVVPGELCSLYPSLQQNDSQRLDFQTMTRINHFLYIAARDHVFAVNLTTAAEHFSPQRKLTWKSKDVNKCTLRGKNAEECSNYIKVLVPRDDETLFICGTNAFNPTCRNYKMNSLHQVEEDLLGQARCPFESGQSNVGLFADGAFYSATMADFLASDAVVYRSLGAGRTALRSVKYDSKWLREPQFHRMVEYGSYIYLFLSEIALEHTELGRVVFSRVSRVCKNDDGGSPRVLERYWTSFLKARLNCSLPGDSFFYFDVLQSLTNVLQINQRPTVVGVFTTQSNSIPGSAVCFFHMDDVEKVFDGKFKEQRSSDAPWSAVPEYQVPQPRPGACAGDASAAKYTSSIQFPDESLSFIKMFPLMDQAVPAVNKRPSFTRTSSRSRLTHVVVDVGAGPAQDRIVLFLGSEDGRVLKVLTSSRNQSSQSLLLEELDVYNPAKCTVHGQQEDRRILGLELDKENHALFVAFSGCLIRVPVSRCSQHATCRRSCLSSRDPYCIWLKTGRCTNMEAGFRAGFEQDIDGDHSLLPPGCHDMLGTRNQEGAGDSYGVQRLPPDWNQGPGPNVHYTLLIASVLVSFLLGTILSGFLVSCLCGRGSAGGAGPLGKDPEASLPHTLSLPSLAKLNGFLDAQIKEEKLDSTTKMYSSLITSARGEPHLHTSGHQGLSLGWHQGLHLGENQGIHLGENQGLHLGENQGLHLGENQGLRLGENQGLRLGENQGLRLGENQGLQLGDNQGLQLGENQGLRLGGNQSLRLGKNQGLFLGENQGLCLGENQGLCLGENQGLQLGDNQGLQLGDNQGLQLGDNQGLRLGDNQGLRLGDNQGLCLGGNQGLRLGENQGLCLGENQGLQLLDLDLSFSQGDGEPSALPTVTTPELPLKNKSFRNHKNCQNTGPGSSLGLGAELGFMAIVGTSVGQQLSLRQGHPGTLGTSSSSPHLPEERKEPAEGGGGTQLPQAPVDVSALDQLIKQIQEVSASGSVGIKVLTSSSSSGGNHHHNHHHHHQQQNIHTRSHHYNISTRHHGIHHSLTSGVQKPPRIPESPQLFRTGGISLTRHHSQRHGLIKMGSSGTALPRHHSFHQRGVAQPHFLARMKTNSSNGPAGVVARANTNANCNANFRGGAASTCLTRQHSYSEPHGLRSAAIRRTVSLKPPFPPKPLFLPNAATTPPTQEGKYKY